MFQSKSQVEKFLGMISLAAKATNLTFLILNHMKKLSIAQANKWEWFILSEK